MCDESGDESLEPSFHVVSKRAKTQRDKTTHARSSKSPEVAANTRRSSSSTSGSSSSSTSSSAEDEPPPVKKRMGKGGRKGKGGRNAKGGMKGKRGKKGKGGRKGKGVRKECKNTKGKGKSSRPKSSKPLKRPSTKKTSDRNSAEKTNHQETKDRLDSFQVSSLEPLKWAEKICLCSANHGGVCPYDSVDIFTEFSGSTCAESAVESVVNHMTGKPPSLNFCYNADVKSACRQVAMSTRHVLGGCSSHQ